MFCWSNCLFGAFQYFAIFLGLNYTSVNIKTGQMKFDIIMKIYVYLSTLLSLAYAICAITDNLTIFQLDETLTFILIIPSIIRVFAIFYLIVTRIQEEKLYSEWLRTYLPLQRKYFEYRPYVANKNMKKYLILQICMILPYSIYKSAIEKYDGKLNFTYFLLLYCHFSYTILPYYVLWHHGVILNYINNIFINLNEELQYQRVQETFTKFYIKTLLLLQQVNAINSAIVLNMLLFLVTIHGYFIFGIYNYLMSLAIFLEYYMQIVSNLLEYIAIFLYFLICENITGTIRDTGRILMEHNAQNQNQEVCFNFKIKRVRKLYSACPNL